MAVSDVVRVLVREDVGVDVMLVVGVEVGVVSSHLSNVLSKKE